MVVDTNVELWLRGYRFKSIHSYMGNQFNRNK